MSPKLVHGIEMREAIENMAQRANEEAANRLVETQTRILAGTFDKATAYTNFLILAGFAGFFGLWQLTADKIDSDLALTSALLMSISITVFVVFEVVKNYFYSRSMNHLYKIISKGNTNDAVWLTKAFSEHDRATERAMAKFIPFWYVAFFGSLVMGLTAAGILMYAFVKSLYT